MDERFGPDRFEPSSRAMLDAPLGETMRERRVGPKMSAELEDAVELAALESVLRVVEVAIGALLED